MPKRWSRLISVGFGVVLLTITASCSSSEPATTPGQQSTTASDIPSTASSGDRFNAGSGALADTVDIGNGRGVHLECSGSGGPTVILMSGFGNAGDIWSQRADDQSPAVAPTVADSARVCSYDRPGSYVTSKVVNDKVVPAEPAPARGTAVAVPRATAADAVADLKSLLTAAEIRPPYVLVGHSLGGLFAELYARTHPGDVAGLVFVDPTTPQLKEVVSDRLYEAMLVDQLEKAPSQIPGYVNETYDFDASMDQFQGARAKPVPAVVLIARQAQAVPNPPPGVSASDIDELFRAGTLAMREFAAEIDADVVSVPDSSHYIHVLRPDTVIKAIGDVTDRAGASPR